MRFDLVDLSLFCHVAEAGSITAPNRAHLALAVASTRIRHMEVTLGAPLLVRGRQGVTPTQAGRTLLRSLGWQERPLWETEKLSSIAASPSIYLLRSNIQATMSSSPISKSRGKVPRMTCCDPLATECPLDLTEDD